jgi:hypothetical protein
MSSRSGGLLELVARGKKDIFFTSNPQVCFFHSVYTRFSPFTKEIFLAKPRNNPEWGRFVDFDIDHRGDVLKHLYLRISLPSWIPPTLTNINKTGLITDLSGVSYGYTNSVGFLMIDKIQYFNDNLLLFEYFGTHMDWRSKQTYETGTVALFSDDIGRRPDTIAGIARSAGASLRVPIPMLGWQRLEDPGLPLSALRGGRYRIRVHLRPYTDILVASDSRIKPNPFNMPLKVQEVQDGVIDTSQKSLPPVCMKGLDISLETTYFYLPNDVNTWLKAATLRFPFRTVQQQIYTLEDNIMNAASTGVTANFPLALEYNGPVDRLLVGIRSEANTLSGQLNNLSPPGGGAFIRSMRLNIANIDRVKSWDIPVFREVSSYWKNKRISMGPNGNPEEVYTVSFGGFDYNSPSGTVSFTRAVLPTLYLVLGSTAYDTRTISRKAYAIVYAEAWNIYEIGSGRGKLMFDD